MKICSPGGFSSQNVGTWELSTDGCRIVLSSRDTWNSNQEAAVLRSKETLRVRSWEIYRALHK
jgi:hypothetical protein